MECGKPSDATPTVSANHFQRMEQQLSHMRKWVNHLVGKVRTLDNENARLQELSHWQAKQIERLREGILVRSPFLRPPVAKH